MNEKILRLTVFIAAAALHLIVLFFLAFNMQRSVQIEDENARIMKLTDIDELPPPPPEPEIPQVEEIAEVMIETDIPPIQEVVAAGTIIARDDSEEYLPMHQLSTTPQFNTDDIIASLVYPPIALRSGIEGRVTLELFVDRTGVVQRVIILREDPEGRGFGESAIRAFTGRKGIPATANGEPVSSRYRYPVTFRLR
jgi:protein TonB